MSHGSLRYTIIVCLALIQFLMAQPASAENAQYRGGANRSGDMGILFAPSQADSPTTPVLFVVEARALRLNYIDDTVIDLPTQCRVHALDALSGRTRWTFTPPGAIYRDFTIAQMPDQSARLVFYSWDQHYYAADARTGALAWRVKDEGPSGSPAAVVSNGIVHTGALALSLNSGREVWRRADDRHFSQAPAVNGAFVYGGGRAIHALTGGDAWSNPLPDDVNTAALLIGSTLIACGTDGKVYAFDADTGEPKWTLEIGHHIYQPSANATHVFIAARDRNLRALDLETGEQTWSVTTVGGFDGTSVVDAGRVFCRTREQFLFALDAATGAEIWKHHIDGEGPIPVDQVVGHGLVFVVTRQQVRALDAATGELKWERAFDLPVDWAHPTLAK